MLIDCKWINAVAAELIMTAAVAALLAAAVAAVGAVSEKHVISE